MIRRHPRSPPFPYTTLFRSLGVTGELATQKTEQRPLQREDEAGRLGGREAEPCARAREVGEERARRHPGRIVDVENRFGTRSEEHTSELQSLAYLVCRLLLE